MAGEGGNGKDSEVVGSEITKMTTKENAGDGRLELERGLATREVLFSSWRLKIFKRKEKSSGFGIRNPRPKKFKFHDITTSGPDPNDFQGYVS